MNLAACLKVSVLLGAWLVFGGAYVLDVLDVSYEMNVAGSDVAQALASDFDDTKSKDLGPSVFSPAAPVCSHSFMADREQLQARSLPLMESPAVPLYQRFSAYRI
jgi:hypothetical protein